MLKSTPQVVVASIEQKSIDFAIYFSSSSKTPRRFHPSSASHATHTVPERHARLQPKMDRSKLRYAPGFRRNLGGFSLLLCMKQQEVGTQRSSYWPSFRLCKLGIRRGGCLDRSDPDLTSSFIPALFPLTRVRDQPLPMPNLTCSRPANIRSSRPPNSAIC